MNLPNKITISRICLIPLVIFFFMADFIPYGKLVAALIFGIAAITDNIDGRIARKRGLVTDLGKFLDPIADKILVMSAFVMLAAQNRMEAWAVVVILAREFIVSGFRLVAAEGGVVIAASTIAKYKTASQMFAVLLTIVLVPGPYEIIARIVLYVSVFLTALSGADYIWKNRKFLRG